MISPSTPEPLCDIEAQLDAVLDPAHPKQSMWIAAGTPRPNAMMPLFHIRMDEGMLISRRLQDILIVSRERHDAALAYALGYLEPKWDAGVNAVVVRALNDDGCVITEMAVSPDRAGEAYHIVKAHGTPELTTIAAALERRRILCASETA